LEPRKEKEELRDQLDLLLLLSALRDMGMTTKRLKLQKLAYFANVFAKLIGEGLTSHQFYFYKMGPFSKQVYSDSERLVALGFVEPLQMKTGKAGTGQSFEYKISEHGMKKVNDALQLPEFEEAMRAIRIALETTGHLGGNSIKRLAYGEPNCIAAKQKGFGTAMDRDYPLATKFADIARNVAKKELNIDLKDDELCWLYVKLMESLQPTIGIK
jgi:uncharacterized protein YwgA